MPGYGYEPRHRFDEGGSAPTPSLPLIVAPNTPPGNVMRGTKRAVISSVDNAAGPKFATVLIDNKLPGESGYSLPAGWGPFAAGGTAGYNYFYNNTSGVGGSWVLVDCDRKMVIALDQGISTTAATPYYKAITDHHHSGNLNSDGYTNPQPVDLTAAESQNSLPYGQNTSVIQATVDSTGQLLTTHFPGQCVQVPSGTLAGWLKSINAAATPVYDNQAYTVPTGSWLWMEWYSIYDLAASGTNQTWGPTVKDTSGNWVHFQLTGTGGGAYYNATSLDPVAAHAANTTAPHKFKFGMYNTGVANKWRIVLYVDNIKAFDETDTVTTLGTSLYPGFYADVPNGHLYFRDYQVTGFGAPLETVDPSLAAVQYKNLLRNGLFFQNGSVLPGLSLGWRSYTTVTEASSGTYTVGGTSYTGDHVTTAAGVNGGIYQLVSLKPNTKYSYAVLAQLDTTTSQCTGRVFIGDSGITTLWNNPGGDPEPAGTRPAFYSAASKWLPGWSDTTPGQWEVLTGSFTTPASGTTAGAFMLQNVTANGTSPSGVTWLAAMLWEGGKYQDYADGESHIGVQPISSFLNPQLPALLPYTANFQLSCKFGTGTTGIGIFYSVYGSNTIGTGVGTDVTFYLPDNTTFTGVHLGTSATVTGSMINSGVTCNSGDSVYFLAYFKRNDTSGVSGTGWHITVQVNTQFTAAQIAAAYADGGFVATVATKNNNSVTAGSGGSGGFGGCPEENQVIERFDIHTQTVEYVPAKELRKGDYLRDPIDGSWNVIFDEPQISRAEIWEVTIAGETVRVDSSHLFMDLNNHWVNVQELEVGHKMHVYPKGEGEVEAIRHIGTGRFVHIHCDNNRYVLGRTVSHNVKPALN